MKPEDVKENCPVCGSQMEAKATVTPKMFLVKCHGFNSADNEKCTYEGVYNVETKTTRGALAITNHKVTAPQRPYRGKGQGQRYTKPTREIYP